MVLNSIDRRKRAFRAALALAGKNVAQFAAANDVTVGHLYAVLGGKRESQTLVAAIDAFIAKHLPSPQAA